MRLDYLELVPSEVYDWRWRAQDLELWLRDVAERQGRKLGRLKILAVTDIELLERNREFLDHDTYTDIITFDYSNKAKVKGELWISIDRIKENASERKLLVEEELLRVIAHGLLHLCGQGDKTRIESKGMQEKENEALRAWKNRGVPRGTIG